MNWTFYAIGAAALYGLHQIFTKLASSRIGNGLGGLIVESVAALIIACYLTYLKFFTSNSQAYSTEGMIYSALTGLCVGVGTIFFFLLFQKGGPLSAVPAILAIGATLMSLAGVLFFKEDASAIKILGMAFSIVGLFLLR
jgi:transporter family protein